MKKVRLSSKGIGKRESGLSMVSMRLKLIRKDGSSVWMLISAKALFDEVASLQAHWQCSLTSPNASKRAEDSQIQSNS